MLIRFKEKLYRVLNWAGLSCLKKLYGIFDISGTYAVSREGAFSFFEGNKYRYSFADFGSTGNVDFAQSAEDETRSKIFSLINSNDVLYDIGAHGGVYTISTLNHFPNITVYSFEPQPDELLENLALNELSVGNVQNVAVGDIDGEVLMTETERSSNHISNSGSIKVRCVRLDDYVLEQKLLPPSWIKIDIEGMELPALKGAEQLLRTNTPSIICEINQLFDRYGTTLSEFANFLTELGYQIYRLKGGGLEQVVLSDQNVISTHPSADNNYWFINRNKSHLFVNSA